MEDGYSEYSQDDGSGEDSEGFDRSPDYAEEGEEEGTGE